MTPARMSLLLAVAIALLAPAAAGPQAPIPPVGQAPPVAQPAPPRLDPWDLDVVFEMGYDLGGEELVKLTFDDGSTDTLRMNEGLFFSLGVSFLSMGTAAAEADTAVTIGFKWGTSGASNGSVDFHSFPLEVVERLRLERIRLAGGITYALNPKISSSGVVSGGDVDLKSSLGWVGRLEYVGEMGRTNSWYLGVRYVWHEFENEAQTAKASGNTFGFVLGFDI